MISKWSWMLTIVKIYFCSWKQKDSAWTGSREDVDPPPESRVQRRTDHSSPSPGGHVREPAQ